MRLHKISIFYLVALFALLSSIGNIWSGEMETLCGDKIFQKDQCQLIGEINNIVKKNSDLLIVGLFYSFCNYWHIRQFGRQSKTNARIGVNSYHDCEYSFVNSRLFPRFK